MDFGHDNGRDFGVNMGTAKENLDFILLWGILIGLILGWGWLSWKIIIWLMR